VEEFKSKRDYQDLLKLASTYFPTTIVVDGYDVAIIGINIRVGQISNLIYSVNQIIKILMQRDNMGYDEAVEFFNYNIKPLENIDEALSPLFFDDRPHFSLN
jgi:hypothetical protein